MIATLVLMAAVNPMCSPTPKPTKTPTPTMTATPTATPTVTVTPTPSRTATPTRTRTPRPSHTPTPYYTPTETPPPGPTPTPTSIAECGSFCIPSFIVVGGRYLMPVVSPNVIEIEQILPSGWIYVREVEQPSNLYLYWVDLSQVRVVIPL